MSGEEEFRHGGDVWSSRAGGAGAGPAGLTPLDVIDFSANINPLGPPARVRELLRANAGLVRFYPPPGAPALSAALNREFGAGAECVLAGNGASELIALFFWVLRLRRVLLVAPTYTDYLRAARAAGCAVEFFNPRGEFAFPLPALAEKVRRSRCDALVFCNPNNPTGVFWDDLTPLLEAAREKKVSFLLDLSFFPFTGEDWAAWAGKNRLFSYLDSPLFLVVSLTKIFALPGLRLGFGIGTEGLVRKMRAAKDPWSVNVLAQLAGLACLEEKEYLKKTVTLVNKEREYLAKGLGRIPGLKVYPSRANFLLVDSRRTGVSGAELAAALAKKDILVRDAGNFRGLDAFFFRVAVRKRKENRILLRAVREVLAGERASAGR